MADIWRQFSPKVVLPEYKAAMHDPTAAIDSPVFLMYYEQLHVNITRGFSMQREKKGTTWLLHLTLAVGSNDPKAT